MGERFSGNVRQQNAAARKVIDQFAALRGICVTHQVIAQAVWLYDRFTLSLRDVEDLLAKRGVTVSYETVRQWCRTFGAQYARRINRHLGPRGDRWFLDEVVVSIQGKRRYLWRAVDQDGDVIDVLLQKRRNGSQPRDYRRGRYLHSAAGPRHNGADPLEANHRHAKSAGPRPPRH